MDRYPAKYTDANGFEDTSITNDGQTLRMVTRGVEFVGTDFDSLEPLADATKEQLRTFSLHNGSLCSCCIELQVPIAIHDNGQEITGNLEVGLQLGGPAFNGALDREELSLVLQYSGQRFVGSGTSASFEDALIEIQKLLPAGVFMRACINCLYSDYSPYGNGLFGTMMCFRNLKQEYLKVTTKDDFWPLHDRYDRLVQETYLCPEFQRRVPGTGYRG